MLTHESEVLLVLAGIGNVLSESFEAERLRFERLGTSGVDGAVLMFFAQGEQSVEYAGSRNAPFDKHGFGPGMGAVADDPGLLQHPFVAQLGVGSLFRRDVFTGRTAPAGFFVRMDADALHGLVEDFHQPPVVAHPDLAAGVFGRDGVIGFGDFNVPVAVNLAATFLKCRE